MQFRLWTYEKDGISSGHRADVHQPTVNITINGLFFAKWKIKRDLFLRLRPFANKTKKIEKIYNLSKEEYYVPWKGFHHFHHFHYFHHFHHFILFFLKIIFWLISIFFYISKISAYVLSNQKIFHNYQLKIIDVSTSHSNLILNRRSEFFFIRVNKRIKIHFQDPPVIIKASISQLFSRFFH